MRAGSGYGGGIEAWSPKRIDFMGDNMKFSGNTALCGDAIWVVNASAITVSGNLQLENNYADLGITLISIKGCIKFIGNFARQKFGSGGAMLLVHISMFQVTGIVVFHNNSAYYGGAFTTLNVRMHLNGHVSFVNNTARSYGGAFYVLRSEMVLGKAVIFHNNTAMIGGALYLIHNLICFLESGAHVV